ncbi:MAG TPA: TrkA family potassium uptake protein [Gaiellaceae bacterium]|nr:TrkA family potassium uptake protein [Gaiellaceae bacterium]
MRGAAGRADDRLMYILIAGGGKVGANLARVLLNDDRHEVTLIEQRRDRFERLEHEFEHQVMLGDATEIFVLERAGIARPPDVVAALTGDDEDNLIICQLAREKYGVPKVIARVNDPRNQAHFDLLGISPTVSATRGLMALIEHEVPEHDLVHLLELRKENLEIVEVLIDESAPAAGKRVEMLELPEGSRLISVMRNGRSEIAVGSTELQPGDQVLAILQPGKEDELKRVLLKA